MRKGEELGIESIKTQSKEGNHKLQALHYRINDILYDYKMRYISPHTAIRVANDLTTLGVEVKEVDVNTKAVAKKEEILSKLRTIVQSLKQYAKSYVWQQSDSSQVEATLKYQISKYIRTKENLDVEKMLCENKQIWEELYLQCPYRGRIQTKKFVDMQYELLDIFNNKYQIK